MSAVLSGVVSFDWLFFSQRYPELIPPGGLPNASAYFNEACLFCDNTPCSPITDSSVGGSRYLLLHMLTAHITALNAKQADGQDASPLVGRIFDATQGSVSVQSEMKGPEPGGKDWYVQTKYGASFWQATAQYRLALYIPGHSHHAIEPYPWGLMNDPWGVY